MQRELPFFVCLFLFVVVVFLIHAMFAHKAMHLLYHENDIFRV